jgi:hypothetical protein
MHMTGLPTRKYRTDINLPEIAQRYELSGASILNIVQFSALRSLNRGDDKIQHSDLLTGIRREFWKEEKSI